MRSLRHPALVLALFLSTSLGSLLPAQEIDSSAAAQLMVMSDGRIVRGKVTRHAVGYYIEKNGGSILVPAEQVRCVARDLQDAYRQQREQMIDPTSTMLIQLAEWCISYRMYDEAGDELRRALRRDPQNEVAREMLDRLDRMMRADPLKSSKAAPRTDSSGGFTADVEALGGLSRPLAAEFTAKIQPLLINKCGNAGCHGTVSDNEFRLAHVRIGGANHRRSSEMNLALALKYVDVAQPLQSALLTTPQGAHGGSSLAIFGGPNGATQESLLKDWVIRVGAERQAAADLLAGRTPLKTPATTVAAKSPFPPVAAPYATAAGQVQTASYEPNGNNVPSEILLTRGEEMPASDNGDILPGSDRPPRPLPRHDKFDPEEFNRQFGQGARVPGSRR